MSTKSTKVETSPAVDEEAIYESTPQEDDSCAPSLTEAFQSPYMSYESDASVPDNQILALSREISTGVATQDEKGLALQALQVSFGVAVIDSVGHLSQQADSFNNIAQQMSNVIAENTVNELPMMDTDSIIDRYSKIQDFQHKVAAFKHKVATGPAMFGNHNMSEDERMILRLVQSFPSVEIRMKFMEMVERFQAEYMPTDSDQFEDETTTATDVAEF